MPIWCNEEILLVYFQLYTFRAHKPIVRSIRCCSIWFSGPSMWMDGGLESRCVGRVYGADGAVLLSRTAPSAPYTWWWAYVPETCRAKNTSIKLPRCIKLAFHIISVPFLLCSMLSPYCFRALQTGCSYVFHIIFTTSKDSLQKLHKTYRSCKAHEV